MPLTPNFSTEQTIGFPSIVTITDDSTGSDVAITQRRVYLVDSEGEYVVPDGTTTDYVEWDYAETTLDIDCLTADSALDITVHWLDVSNVVLYSKTLLKGFTLYNETFYYSLTQSQATQATPPNIIQDTGYYANKLILRTLIDSGNQAITYGDDIATAQTMYNQATQMVTNQDYYF